MAHTSFPNDAYNGRAVTLAEYEQVSIATGLSGMLFYNGVPPVFADSTGRQVKLRGGVSAWIRGTRFNTSSDTIIPIDPNTSGKTRIDLVVLRKRREESGLGVGDHHTVSPVVIQGVPATNPTPPAPVRSFSSSTSFYDITLAEVTVPHNAAVISATQVACRAYYINGTGYTGRDDWTTPPVEPGVIFQANDTGNTYIGTAGWVWQQFTIDTGWVAINNGQSMAGWDIRSLAVARHGNLVVLIMDILRTGAPVGAGTHQYFGPIPEQFRPVRPINGATHVGSPDHSTHTTVNPDGVIILVGNGAQGINTGGQVVTNMSWTVTPRTASESAPAPRT